jgi:hypothetical protein
LELPELGVRLPSWGLQPHSAYAGLPNLKLGIADIGFDDSTAVTMKNDVFWDMESCGLTINRRFEGIVASILRVEAGAKINYIYISQRTLYVGKIFHQKP